MYLFRKQNVNVDGVCMNNLSYMIWCWGVHGLVLSDSYYKCVSLMQRYMFK